MPRRSPALVLVHVVWATSHRRHILPPAFDPLLAAILGHKAHDLACALLAAGCGPDHVHVLLRVAPTIALSDLVQRMKGASTHDVNQRRLLPGRLAWQAGYWAESLGPLDLDTLTHYLRSQRERHDDSHPAERWQFAFDGEPAEGGL
jgi:REP element-mobilizing transposase RayT